MSFNNGKYTHIRDLSKGDTPVFLAKDAQDGRYRF